MRRKDLFTQETVPSQTPMICNITKSTLLYAVNKYFSPSNQIPEDAVITVGGAGYCGEEATVTEDNPIQIRWKK